MATVTIHRVPSLPLPQPALVKLLSLQSSDADVYLFVIFFPPDKICDQISDAILDAHLKQDPDAKIACGETCYVSLIIMTDVTKI